MGDRPYRGLVFDGASCWAREICLWFMVCGVLCSSHLGVARDVPITILCTTDIHGHILPGRDYEGRRNVGGLLRCASAIEAVRAECANVIYVDCGDLVQGAPENGLTRGQLAVRAINWLRCDAWVLGNHDFDWGIETLARLHDMTSAPMLAANIRGADLQGRLPKLRPYVVKEIEGVRIALIGLTTPGTPAWLRHDLRGDIVFENSVDSLRRVMPAVRRERPDILILLAHQGLPEFQDDHANEILSIVRECPEFDLIFGGHTHKNVPGVRLGRTLYVQAGYFANWLARVDLTFDTVRRDINVRSFSIVEIGTNWQECAELRRALGRDLETTEKTISREIGYCENSISARSRGTSISGMQELIARAILWRTRADAVLVGQYGEEGFEPGKITVADVWRAIPYENTIGLISLTPGELRMVLEENATWKDSRHALTLWGLQWDAGASASNSGAPRLRWPNGQPVHGRQRIRVAVSSYVLASGGRRYSWLPALARRPECRLSMTGIDTRGAVIDYVRKVKRIGTDLETVASAVVTHSKNDADEQRAQP